MYHIGDVVKVEMVGEITGMEKIGGKIKYCVRNDKIYTQCFVYEHNITSIINEEEGNVITNEEITDREPAQ